MDSLIKRFVPVDTQRSVIDDIKVLAMRYILRDKGWAETSAALRKLQPNLRIQDFRDSLSNDAYILKNIKLWLIEMSATSAQRASRTADFGILPEDRGLYALLPEATARKIRAYVRKSKNFVRKTPAEFDQLLAKLIDTELINFTQKFTYRKMRFTGVDTNELASELIRFGLRGVLLKWPDVQSEAHVTNLLKQTIHNQGINLIDSHTTESRSIYQKDDDGNNQSRVASLSAFDTPDDVGAVSPKSTIALQVYLQAFLSDLKTDEHRRLANFILQLEPDNSLVQNSTRRGYKLGSHASDEAAAAFLKLPAGTGVILREDAKRHFASVVGGR